MAKSSSKRRQQKARRNRQKTAHSFRTTSLRVEALEPRMVLSASPVLAPFAEGLVLNAGTPLYIALDGYDPDSDHLTYEVEVSGDLSASVLEGNRSVKMTVADYGEMTFELFEQRAPNTTSQIIGLVEDGFYDGLTFHRIAEYSDGTPFVIQGGCPNGDGTGGPGFKFDDEFHPELLHTSSGLLSMANSGDDTNGSQFFITGSATTHLDFNHSVFGFLTEGDDVRQAIEAADVDANNKPVNDIVIESVEVFYDEENGTLMLTAPEGTTGTGEVTIRCYDTEGNMTEQTFEVTIAEDHFDRQPYLQEINPIEVKPGESTEVQLEGFSLDDDYLGYDGMVYPESDDIAIEIDPYGKMTITATDSACGVYSVYVGVHELSDSRWDSQMIPVYVQPDAPSSIELIDSFDTGVDDADGITSENQQLQFRLTGIQEGAEVSIFADGQLIASGTADASEVILIANPEVTLADGDYEITATQTLKDSEVKIGNLDETVDLVSDPSEVFSITIDTEAPVILSDPLTQATAGMAYAYLLDIQTGDSTGLYYELTAAPSGMTVDPATGEITWMPTSAHNQSETVTVKVTDAAGNEVTQTCQVEVALGPIVQTIQDQTIDEHQTLSVTIEAESGIDNDPSMTFGLQEGMPEGVAIDSETGVLTWTPTEAQGPGQYTITVSVTNANGAITYQSFDVAVGEVNVAPVLDPIDNVSIDEGALLDFLAEASDEDLPVGDLIYSLVDGTPAGVSIDATTGRLTWQPGETHGGGTYELTVQVTDSAGATDEKTFSVTVNEIDEAPVFDPTAAVTAIPGIPMEITVKAQDPDLPTHAIEYRFTDPTQVPDGITLDAQTGQLHWDVPESIGFETFVVSIEAVEQLGDGTDGLATTQAVTIEVINPWAMAFNGTLRETRSVLSRAEIDSRLLDAISNGAAPQNRLRSRSVTSQPDSIGHEGTLGFQLAPDTESFGRASARQQERSKKNEEDGNEKPETDRQESPATQPGSKRRGNSSENVHAMAETEMPMGQIHQAEAIERAFDQLFSQASDESIEQIVDQATE